MAKVRPSLILRMHVVESLANDQVKADFNRAYSYVAPSLAELAEGRFADENTIEMQVVLHHGYWLSAEDGADESWDEVMLPWLTNMFYKVSNNLVRCYVNESGTEQQPVHFDWLEVDFPTVHVALKLGKDCSIPSIALDVAKRVRAMANDGSLGEGAQVVRAPSRASYQAQLEAARKAQAAAEAEEGAEGVPGQEEHSEPGEAVPAHAQERTLEADGAKPAGADKIGADADGAASDDGCANEEPGDEQADSASCPDFEIDYTTWGIEREDGTVDEIEMAL